ncbi:MAG: DNA alkylation repair protein [Chitinophagales bacterium]|nr:DNA alkylation repair protein [Chitinophagales bacterium]
MMNNNTLQQSLATALQQAAVTTDIIPMQNYMKNKFAFFGVRSTNRRTIFKTILKTNGLPNEATYQAVVLSMMQHEKREMHYCAIDLVIQCQKKYSASNDIDYITTMITTNSWWDSVDGIAPNILAYYLKQFPNKIDVVIDNYMKSNNIWLQRSCLLFQLKYKQHTNEQLLFDLCKQLSTSNEFFIQKAIGWSLREYAKTNQQKVYQFVAATPMSNLSRREALKHQSV